MAKINDLGSGPSFASLFRAYPPCRWVAPGGNDVHVAFRVPARKRVKYVWTYWGAAPAQLKPALAAHHRLGKSRDGPNPIQAFVRAAACRNCLGGDPFGVPGRSRLELLGRRCGLDRIFRNG